MPIKMSLVLWVSQRRDRSTDQKCEESLEEERDGQKNYSLLMAFRPNLTSEAQTASSGMW